MSLIHNEQTKLTAGAIDRISTACIAVGVIAPMVGAIFGVPGYTFGLGLLGFSLAWLAIGAILHLTGRAVLRRLRE